MVVEGESIGKPRRVAGEDHHDCKQSRLVVQYTVADRTVQIPIEAATLLASNALPSSLIFASRQGKVIRTDLHCKVVNEWSPTEVVILDKAILLHRRNCKFIQAESFSGGAALVLIYNLKDSVHLQLLSFGLEGEMSVHKSLKVLGSMKKVRQIKDAANAHV